MDAKRVGGGIGGALFLVVCLALSANAQTPPQAPTLLAPGAPSPSAYQCSDGVDNDGDDASPIGGTDYPDDPGCWGPRDNDEGFPSAATTGPYSSGTTLRGQCIELCSRGMTASGSITTSSPGTTIQCIDFNDGASLTIDDPNTIVRCVYLVNSRPSQGMLTITPAGDHTVVEDSTFGASGGAPGAEVIVLRDASDVRLERIEVFRVDDAYKADGVDNLTIRDSYVHTPVYGSGDPHADGFECDGGCTNVVVEGNAHRQNQDEVASGGLTSNFMLDNWAGGTTNNITVRRNLLDWQGASSSRGGGYAMYCDGNFNSSPMNQVSYVFNLMQSGFAGYILDRGTCRIIISGNKHYQTGVSVSTSDGTVQCNDGIDNDGDGLFDYGVAHGNGDTANNWNDRVDNSTSGSGCANGWDDSE